MDVPSALMTSVLGRSALELVAAIRLCLQQLDVNAGVRQHPGQINGRPAAADQHDRADLLGLHAHPLHPSAKRDCTVEVT